MRPHSANIAKKNIQIYGKRNACVLLSPVSIAFSSSSLSCQTFEYKKKLRKVTAAMPSPWSWHKKRGGGSIRHALGFPNFSFPSWLYSRGRGWTTRRMKRKLILFSGVRMTFFSGGNGRKKNLLHCPQIFFSSLSSDVEMKEREKSFQPLGPKTATMFV